MTDKKLDALTKWPDVAEDVTVDLMLRIIGADTQRQYLLKWAEIDKDREHFKSPLYMARVVGIISAVGLMACLRTLRECDPAAAKQFAQEYWSMCDAGDSIGEALWEFTEAAGLDPELIKLPTDEVVAPSSPSGAGEPEKS